MTDEETISRLSKKIAGLYQKIKEQNEMIEKMKNCTNCAKMGPCIKYLYEKKKVCEDWELWSGEYRSLV